MFDVEEWAPQLWRGRICIDRRCEESSVLAAGAISKAADVGFIDGVQEWAVSLKHTSRVITLRVSVHSHIYSAFPSSTNGHGEMTCQCGILCLHGSCAAVWLEAGFWTGLSSPPAAAARTGLRGRGSPPGPPLTTRRWTWPEWTHWERGACWGPQWLVSAGGRWPAWTGILISTP